MKNYLYPLIFGLFTSWCSDQQTIPTYDKSTEVIDALSLDKYNEYKTIIQEENTRWIEKDLVLILSDTTDELFQKNSLLVKEVSTENNRVLFKEIWSRDEFLNALRDYEMIKSIDQLIFCTHWFRDMIIPWWEAITRDDLKQMKSYKQCFSDNAKTTMYSCLVGSYWLESTYGINFAEQRNKSFDVKIEAPVGVIIAQPQQTNPWSLQSSLQVNQKNWEISFNQDTYELCSCTRIVATKEYHNIWELHKFFTCNNCNPSNENMFVIYD